MILMTEAPPSGATQRDSTVFVLAPGGEYHRSLRFTWNHERTAPVTEQEGEGIHSGGCGRSLCVCTCTPCETEFKFKVIDLDPHSGEAHERRLLPVLGFWDYCTPQNKENSESGVRKQTGNGILSRQEMPDIGENGHFPVD